MRAATTLAVLAVGYLAWRRWGAPAPAPVAFVPPGQQKRIADERMFKISMDDASYPEGIETALALGAEVAAQWRPADKVTTDPTRVYLPGFEP